VEQWGKTEDHVWLIAAKCSLEQNRQRYLILTNKSITASEEE